MSRYIHSDMTAPEVITEIDWLLTFDVHPEQIAAQLGRSLTALERLARRQNRNDLSAMFCRHISTVRRAA